MSLTPPGYLHSKPAPAFLHENEMSNEYYSVLGKITAGAFVAIGIVAILAGEGIVLAFPIKWTWNATMPYLFALPTITWGKAWCLNFLCGCLLKSSKTTKGE